jgi:hypothetical protein
MALMRVNPSPLSANHYVLQRICHFSTSLALPVFEVVNATPEGTVAMHGAAVPLGQVEPPEAQPALVPDEPALAANQNAPPARLWMSLHGFEGIGIDENDDA